MSKDSFKGRKRANTASSEKEIGEKHIFDSTYKPMDYSEVEKYKVKELIHDLPLSSCQVFLVAEEGSEKVRYKDLLNQFFYR